MIDPAALQADPARILPGCACRLAKTILRIHGKAAPLTVLTEAERVEDSDPYTDPAGFEIHMRIEEAWIFPAMHPDDRARGMRIHTLLRRGAGVRVFLDHAAWERAVFPTLGIAA